jgi:hypothetical protein
MPFAGVVMGLSRALLLAVAIGSVTSASPLLSQNDPLVRAELAVARTLFQRFGHTVRFAVSPYDSCEFALPQDVALCVNGRPHVNAVAVAQARMLRFAAEIGADTATSTAVVRAWRSAGPGPATCRGASRVFTVFAPASSAEIVPGSTWMIRVFANSFPLDERCEGWASLFEFVVSRGPGGTELKVSEPRTIIHYSGLTPHRPTHAPN